MNVLEIIKLKSFTGTYLFGKCRKNYNVKKIIPQLIIKHLHHTSLLIMNIQPFVFIHIMLVVCIVMFVRNKWGHEKNEVIKGTESLNGRSHEMKGVMKWTESLNGQSLEMDRVMKWRDS